MPANNGRFDASGEGQFQGQFVFNEAQMKTLRKLTLGDFDQRFKINDLGQLFWDGKRILLEDDENERVTENGK